MIVKILVAILIGLSVAPGWCQTQTPPLAGPMLNRAAACSEWTVRFTYSKSNANGQSESASPNDDQMGKVQLLTVTKTFPIWHAVTVGKAGIISDCWGDARQTYSILPKVTEATVIARSQETDKFDVDDRFSVGYDKTDFPDMEWVSAKTFRGVIKDGAILIFQEGGDGASVYIDAQTRLPIRWQKGGEMRDFHFLPPPSSKLAFPPQVLATREAAQKVFDATNWPPTPKMPKQRVK